MIGKALSFPIWMRYSKKLAARIEKPQFAGHFSQAEATARNMRLVLGREGTVGAGAAVCLYWLVDEEDGVIADAKFQVFGHSALIGAADAACELSMRKNYDQARRIGAELIDTMLRDKSGEEACPPETSTYLNCILAAIEDAAAKCTDIPFADTYVAPPMPGALDGQEAQVWPGWAELSVKQKIAVIEQVIESDIRPYIELDAGGVQVVNLVEEHELIIAYQGSCTTCYSATGATLNAIQQILRTKVHPDLIVTPDASFLAY